MRYVRLIFDEHDRVGRWVVDRTGGVWSPIDAKAIGLERRGDLVGGVVYDQFNGASVRMTVASDGSRRWMNRDFLRASFRFPFVQMGVRKVIGEVVSSNLSALEFDRNLGFIVEGRIAGAHPYGDIMILTMTRDQCRWL